MLSPKSRLTRPLKKPKATWVEPALAAEVEYRDITSEGLLRQSSFKGLSTLRRNRKPRTKLVPQPRLSPTAGRHGPAAPLIQEPTRRDRARPQRMGLLWRVLQEPSPLALHLSGPPGIAGHRAPGPLPCEKSFRRS